MALKAILLNKQLESLRSKREELIKVREGLQSAEKELETAIGEAKTEEENSVVETAIEEHEKNVAKNNEDISGIDTEIETAEKELQEISEKSKPDGNANTRSGSQSAAPAHMTQNNFNYEGRNNMLINSRTAAAGIDRRERMRGALQNQEVRSFFETLVDFKVRGITGKEVLMPEIVIDMIKVDMTFVGNIYNLVTVQKLKGEGKIILSGDTPDALWLDCCGPVSEVDLDFSRLNIDCYKVGAFVAVCNAILEDSIINLAVHIQQQFVKSILKSLDKVILTGDPSEDMPTGIIPVLPEKNKISCSSDYATVYSYMGEFPDDAANLTAVMTRSTYFKNFAGQTILPTSSGQLVMSSPKQLPDGTPVVFASKKIIPDNQMLIGDFSKYFLAERASPVVASSKEVKFLDDETVFKVTARYDGKPMDEDYWLLFTLTEPMAGFSVIQDFALTEDNDLSGGGDNPEDDE